MLDDETPPDRTPITVPPTRQQIEAARDLCFKMLDTMFMLSWDSQRIARSYDYWHADDEQIKSPRNDEQREDLMVEMPSWATAALETIAEINRLDDEAKEVVQPWAFFFDSFSGEVLSVGSKSYSNALLAILGVGHDFMLHMDRASETLEFFDLRLPVYDTTVVQLAKTAHFIWDQYIAAMGSDFRAVNSYLQAHLRNQAAKAFVAVGQAKPDERISKEQPVHSDEEKMIIEALRKSGKRMKQVQLLGAARLEAHGNYKFLVAQMYQRGLIDHGPGQRGSGFGLPEWKDLPG